jgi:5'-nucleotidase
MMDNNPQLKNEENLMSKVRHSFLSVLLLAASFVLASCASIDTQDRAVTVSFISFNDFHGNLLPPSSAVTVENPGTGKAVKVPAGGVAYLATLVKNLKAQNPGNTMVVAAGDLIGASPQVSGMFHDEPSIDAMNLLGLDVSTVGNHEFDKGRSELLRMQNGGCFPKSADSTRGIVGGDTCMNDGKFDGAKFRYLSANVIDEKTGNTLLPPFVVRSLGGVKIGIIGVTLKDTPAVVTPAGVEGLRFADEAATVNQLIPVLRQQGVEIVIVLLHEGAATTARKINDKRCPGFSGDAIKIVDRFDPAVQVVVTGHTHEEFICRRPDGKLMTQAGHYGRMATKIDLTVDPVTGKVLKKDATNHVAVNDIVIKGAKDQPLPIPEGYARLTKDPELDALVQRYARLTAERAEVVVARIDGYLERKQNSAGESPMGAVIADAYLAATTDGDYGAKAAQIAFVNPGGIRTDLTRSLNVTYGNLYSVHPFNNNRVTMVLTGAQILRLLEQQWESPQPGGGRVLSVSSGFAYTWDASQPEGAAPGKGRRVVPDSMTLNGEPIDLTRSYRVTVNSFLASGGDNFTVLAKGKRVQDGILDLDALTAYFKAKKTVAVPVLDRIKRIN